VPNTAATTATTPAATVATGQGAAIVSQIADQVIRKVDGKSTSFDIALNPAGLGQVNVKVAIDASGQVTASLSFANPHAAAEAQGRAGDLQHALEQAGFNLSQGGLSFSSNDSGAGFAGQNSQSQGGGTAAQTFAASSQSINDSLANAAAAALAARSPSAAGGVDIRI
jgi:flagellar hook-length control protein FliK